VDVSPSGSAISGTSYAAPVVSAIVALVRARSPELTARQVMQRIEDTAQQPSSRWTPVVGHGVVDALAAVSGPGGQGRTGPAVAPVSVGAGRVAGDAPQRTAVHGAVACFVLTACIALASAVIGRLRHRREPVPGD
jgi:membrane-anchored mycosin MYCP